jgi:hypothetical protein
MFDQRGTALIGALIVLVVLASVGALLATNIRSDTQMRAAFGSTLTGFYAAESGLNVGMAEFRNIFLNYQIPTGTDFDQRSFTIQNRKVNYQLTERPGNPTELTIPSGEIFAGVNSTQYRFTVNASSWDLAEEDMQAELGAEFLISYIPLFQFVAFYKDDLEIAPGPEMHLLGRVHTNSNLYMSSGNVLYVEDAPASGLYTVQISAGGDIHRGFKAMDSCGGQLFVDMLADTVAPAGDLDPQELVCGGAGTRLIPQAELDAWLGSMVSQVENIALPEPDAIERGTGGFWLNADLRIVLKLNTPGFLVGGPVLPHKIEVQDASGNADAGLTTQLENFMSDAAWNAANSTMPGTMPIFYTDEPDFGAGCGCGPGTPICGNTLTACYTGGLPDPTSTQPLRVNGVYDIMGSAVGSFDLDYRRGGYYNHREQEWMVLLNINLADLISWNDQNGQVFFPTADATHGGLVIFASVEGPDSAVVNNYGVRVFGTADIPLPGGVGISADPTGATVVTDQAIYVVGDYNRGLAVGGTTRQPAALIGDSLNVMSQRFWRSSTAAGCLVNCCDGPFCRDGQSVQPLADPSRDASNTTINAGFLGGVDATVPGSYPAGYNGGLENYPRFHEDWSAGLTLFYRGSFVSLGEPQHVDGTWCGTGSICNIYDPPIRNWNYDPEFSDVANLPPLTPRFVFVKQIMFTEVFQ